MLGLFEDWDCSISEHALGSGDLIAFYTDGVTESFGVAGDEFGEERLVETLRRCRELPVEAVIQSIVGDVRRFSPHEQSDDITLIIARCRGN